MTQKMKDAIRSTCIIAVETSENGCSFAVDVLALLDALEAVEARHKKFERAVCHYVKPCAMCKHKDDVGRCEKRKYADCESSLDIYPLFEFADDKFDENGVKELW